ncbi:MAG TPA: hypothetical protein VEK08_07705 [Planctomycetota bacterium]|nr:hypothetical protein [Planctomycetota bacterium]
MLISNKVIVFLENATAKDAYVQLRSILERVDANATMSSLSTKRKLVEDYDHLLELLEDHRVNETQTLNLHVVCNDKRESVAWLIHVNLNLMPYLCFELANSSDKDMKLKLSWRMLLLDIIEVTPYLPLFVYQRYFDTRTSIYQLKNSYHGDLAWIYIWQKIEKSPKLKSILGARRVGCRNVMLALHDFLASLDLFEEMKTELNISLDEIDSNLTSTNRISQVLSRLPSEIEERDWFNSYGR